MEHTEKVTEQDMDNQSGGAFDRRGRTLYEILDDFAERIPHEIKDRFPDDFIENMNHREVGYR